MIPLNMTRENRSGDVVNVQLDPYRDTISDYIDTSNSYEWLPYLCARSRVHTSPSIAW